ncbi:50S ribosomal protein L10 [Acidimicrobiia bacterium EGI L10123]|uniref:50S ribosomal protein L10 n=1 Tax=Salinilacustrithrix flava TaxID=2957203 RepID=UPI003D7C3026|nr:50S ribosomal protein L10 [Acidimicrobiia bacterium EGI L10123]
MENPRPEKVAVVDEVRERFDGTSAAILTEYRGLSVGQLAELRTRLRGAGGDFKVYKNTLVRFAARDLGLEIEELLTGPTAIAFVTEKPSGDAGDAVDVAKVLKDFGKEFPALVVKGGLLGDKLLTADDTRALADVEPREVLLARLAGAMAAPMQQLAGLLQALPRNMAYGLKALIDQGGASGAPADAAPAADADESTTDEAPAPAEAETTNDDAPATAEADTTEAEDTPAAEAAPAADTDTQES